MKNGVHLDGRILWFDGDSSFEPEALYDYILSGKTLNEHIYVIEETDDILQYNSLTNDTRIEVKTELRDISKEWNIPQHYLNLDIKQYLLEKLLKEIAENDHFDENDIDDRTDRVDAEIKLFEYYDMVNILRTAIYITETFKERNVIWGTGRGSSCCCYCLYLIELHDVDSVLFDLDLTEFFRG